jgi:hypothetical protein
MHGYAEHQREPREAAATDVEFVGERIGWPTLAAPPGSVSLFVSAEQ